MKYGPLEFLRRRMDEIVTLVFLALLLALAHYRHAPLFEPLRWGGLTMRALFGAVILVLIYFMCKFFGVSTPDLRHVVEYAAEFIPYVFALIVYESLKHLHATALTVWLGIRAKDPQMMAVDIALFGKTPCLWLAQWGLDGRVFTFIMTFFYSLYYLAPVIALGWFMVEGDMVQFRLLRRGVLIVLYGGYCSYVLIPVAGPLTLAPPVHPLFFEKMTDYSFLMANFRYSFDCFPSLHTAVPWVLVLLCRRKLNRPLMFAAVFAATGITFSTIALRFHYGVDVLAGLAWAWAASVLARATFPRGEAEVNERLEGRAQLVN